jgi:hypothetical protein
VALRFPPQSKVFACDFAGLCSSGSSVANQLRVNSRRDSELPKVEFVARDAEVLNKVRDDSARHIARRPREGDEPVGPKRIGVMPVTAGCAKEFAANLVEPAFQLAAIECGVFAHASSSENELVAKSSWDGASGFEERLQMSFGGLLKTQGRFAPVASVGMAAGKQRRLGNPHAIFILTELHFGERNNHRGEMVNQIACVVKRAFVAGDPRAFAFICG